MSQGQLNRTNYYTIRQVEWFKLVIACLTGRRQCEEAGSKPESYILEEGEQENTF